MQEKKIPTSEAEVGMIVTRPIADNQGRVILTEGGRLTPAHVKRLEKWGIDEIFIDIDGEDPQTNRQNAAESQETPSIQLDEKYMHELAEIYNTRFREVAEKPLMSDLKKIAFKSVVLAGRGTLPGLTTK